MPRKSKYQEPRRVNIILEAHLHDAAVERAETFRLIGGFSEYVARLIAADRKRKGRAVLAQGERSLRAA